MNHSEKKLSGGNSTDGVVRIDDTVHRPVSANGEFVHSLLIHLEKVGFAGSPRFQGKDDKGREVLTFFDGVVPHNVQDIKWTNEQLSLVARLLMDFHDATAGTSLAEPNEVVCHNDYAPWNVVFMDDKPRAIIDFDDAAPGSRIKDLSYALWCWLGIGSEAHSAEEQAERIHLVCNVYGVSTQGVLSEISKRQHEIYDKHHKSEQLIQAQRVKRDMQWLDQNKEQLASKLKNLTTE